MTTSLHHSHIAGATTRASEACELRCCAVLSAYTARADMISGLHAAWLSRARHKVCGTATLHVPHHSSERSRAPQRLSDHREGNIKVRPKGHIDVCQVIALTDPGHLHGCRITGNIKVHPRGASMRASQHTPLGKWIEPSLTHRERWRGRVQTTRSCSNHARSAGWHTHLMVCLPDVLSTRTQAQTLRALNPAPGVTR